MLICLAIGFIFYNASLSFANLIVLQALHQLNFIFQQACFVYHGSAFACSPASTFSLYFLTLK